jgi:hypothetical protein
VNTHQGRERELNEPVLVRMRDGELIEGLLSEFDLDQPDFELSVTDEASNNRRVLIPFTSVKSILLRRRVSDGDFRSAGHLHGFVQKVAIHFWDGDVVKGFIRYAPSRLRYGLEVEVHNRNFDIVEVLAIPHSAVKGVFYLKSWDGRAGEFDRETGHWEPRHHETPLVDLLGEIRSLDRLRSDGRLSDDEFVRRRRYVLDSI